MRNTNLAFLVLSVGQDQAGDGDHEQCDEDGVLPGVEDFFRRPEEDNVHRLQADLGPVDRVGHSDRLRQEGAGPDGDLRKLQKTEPMLSSLTTKDIFRAGADYRQG